MEPVTTTNRTLTADDFFNHIGRLYVSWQESVKQSSILNQIVQQQKQEIITLKEQLAER